MTEMERRLLEIVTKMEAEAAEREQRLTSQIVALTEHVNGLSKSVGQLQHAYGTLAAKWNEEWKR